MAWKWSNLQAGRAFQPCWSSCWKYGAFSLASPLQHSAPSLSDKITALGARWCGNLPSVSWLLSPFLEGFLSFTFNFVTNYQVKVTLYSWIKILVLRGIKTLVLILTNVNIFIFKIKSKHSPLIKLTNEYNDRITKLSINYNWNTNTGSP